MPDGTPDSIQPTDSAPVPGSREALDRLRSASKSEQGRAIDSLYGRINKRAEIMAGKMLGPKVGRVDLQPESVVISVLVKELPKLAVVCNDDQHLEARLLRAIRNRFIDRLRARKEINPDSRDARGDQTTFDTPDDADGPRSIIVAFEESRVEQEALARLVTRLTAACKTNDERTMVEQFLVKNQPWSSIASQLGKNETAAKVAFSRLRQRLLDHVMQPLRPSLSGPEWVIVQALCIDRRSLPETAVLASSTPQSVHNIFQTRVLAALKVEYGQAGIESLIRLIGKVRTT